MRRLNFYSYALASRRRRTAPSAANNWGLDTPNPILPFNDYYGHPPSARALLNAIRNPSSITVIDGVTGAPYRPGPDAGGGANS